MPPSTATQRETLLLDALDAVQRDAWRWRTARARARSAALRAPVPAPACDDRADVLLDRGRRGLILGVAHAEAAAEVPDGEARRAWRARRRRGGTGRGSSSCEPMWACRPVQLKALDAHDPLDRRGRVGHGEAELGVGLPGGDLLVRLAGDVGRDAQQHRLRGAGPSLPRRRRGARRASSRARRSISSKLSTTIAPTRWPRAAASSASDLALPCSTSRSGAKPAASARCSSPPEATSQHSPSLGEQGEHGGAGKRLRGEHHVEVLVAGVAAGLRGTRARGRAGRPRRRRRRASRTRARARSRRSPPTSRRPRSLRRLPSGKTSERVVPVWPCRLIIVAAGALPLGGAALRRRARARPPRRRRRPSRAAPSGDQHDALELRRGEPGEHLLVAPDELDEEALETGAR